MNETAETIESKEEEYPILNIEEPEFCKLKVHYVADPEVVEAKVEEALASLRKLKIPGFRKGKAPDSAIRVRLRPQINQFIAREMATHAIDDIVFETDIKPIGQPSFSNISIKGNKFSCDVELAKKPEFELSELKFEVPKPDVGTDAEALAEKSLFNLRLRVGETEPYEEDDFVELGDQVTFSFEGSIDGEPFEGSVAEGEMYEIGSDRWSGWDQNLIGMKADETREFDFVFETGPDELVGKTAKFSVTIHMGTKRKPHSLNEEFYKTMGVENVEEMMDKLRAISKASIKHNEQQAIRSQVAIRLVDQNDFEVPKFLIELEAKNIAGQAGIDFDKMLSDEDKKQVLEQAEKNVRLTLILDSVRESEPDSVLNDGEAQNHLAQHLQAQGQDPGVLFNDPSMRPQLAQLIHSIKEEFTLQWVADQATIIE